MTHTENGFRVVNQVDESSWSTFVGQNPAGGVFQTPEMFQVFEKAHLHKPKLWAAVDSNNEPAALFLSVDISVFEPMPLRYMSTRSVVYGSPVVKEGTAGTRALGVLLDEYGSRGGATMFTEFRNVTDTSDCQPVLEAHGVAFEDHLNFLVELDANMEQAWDRVKSSAQRNIRKARKAGVEVTRVTNRDEMGRVYDILASTYRRIQVPLPDRSLFDAAFDLLSPRDELFVLGAYLDDAMIGALFLLVYGQTATYWYTGSLREHSKLRANDLLVWEGMKTAADAGATVFDFGGAGKPDEDYGVRDFKAKFGGELVNFGRNVMVHAPMRLKVSTAAYDRFSRFLR